MIDELRWAKEGVCSAVFTIIIRNFKNKDPILNNYRKSGIKGMTGTNLKIYNFESSSCKIARVSVLEDINDLLYTWNCALFISCYIIAHSDV
jgi:hypothetical protein